MTVPFTITVDPAARLLRATMNTFFDDATAQGFVRALEQAVVALRRQPGPCYWLVDTTNAPPQSQATTTLIQETVARLTHDAIAVVAVIVPSAIVALQVRRVRREGHEMFAHRAEAEDWLRTRGATIEGP